MQALRGRLSIGQVRSLSTAAPDSSSIANSILKTLNLRSGEALVQNEGDSDIGKAIIQLAKERGITTINIIADKPGSFQLIEVLKKLGGDIVVTEDYARTWYMKRLVAEVKPIAGLNFTDDSQATAVGKAVTEGGTLLTYGKKLPSHVVYEGAIRKPVEWSEFLTKKKLKAQLM
jgi:trans-2-enoyl-CoA reductase